MMVSVTSNFSSSSSPLPLHELKVLQEYIHQQNIQIIGNVNPKRRKDIMLSQFFKTHKTQTVKVIRKSSLLGDQGLIAKTEAVGRDFVILTTLLRRYWLPFQAIVSAEQPFDQANVPHQPHQQVVYDDELKQKIMLCFGKTVGQKEFLKQQFFDQTFAGHLKVLLNNRLTVETDTQREKVKLTEVGTKGITMLHQGKESFAPWKDIVSIEKQRFS
ncbi:hypothetical protein ACH6EH_18865 [Paenibacillus sp. JSM ZJ436]|uniref:hypothetical protein n=1 Tax=Paenibacillus sp. JSM ZJ436 TaxID=3376190 RepID=UPI00378CD299